MYIFLAIVSTIILWSSGSTRLSRLLTWIATWDCFKCLYGTPLYPPAAASLSLSTCCSDFAHSLAPAYSRSGYLCSLSATLISLFNRVFGGCRTSLMRCMWLQDRAFVLDDVGPYSFPNLCAHRLDNQDVRLCKAHPLPH